jgi:hypothetical protein
MFMSISEISDKEIPFLNPSHQGGSDRTEHWLASQRN